jgi:DNA-binding transcriptional LysR family regulator
MMYIRIMHSVHMLGADLNLLLALDALLEEKNVTRAADRIGITQSAMSHALGRLRRWFGDELLTRARSGMVLTQRAEALKEPLRDALSRIDRALAPPESFDPKTARAKIAIGTSDYVELVALPSLVERLEREAPGVDLRVHALGDAMSQALASGAIDIAIAPVPSYDQGPGIRARALFDERFVCVMRRGHPLATKKLTLARFATASHALVAPRGKEGGIVDDALARHGLSRRVAVAVPHFLIAPHVLGKTDLILTLPERVANVLAKALGLATAPLPLELRAPGFTMSAIWHERTHNEPAQRWLRELLVEVTSTRRARRDLPRSAKA